LDRGTRNLHSPAHVPPELEYAVPVGMSCEQFHAMGTTITLLLPEGQAVVGSKLIRGLFTEWEFALSRFLPESELSRLNRHTGVPVMVSELLYTVTAKALAAARATDGLYDPTLLDQLTQIGYDRSFDELPAVLPDAAYNGRPGGGWHDIHMNPVSRCLTLPPGLRLDFGGIAKGMSVDAALERLRQVGITPALVNAGGDLAMEGLPPQDDAWPIAVEGKDMSWTIPLHRGAMATSGIARRHWVQGQKRRHHLLDPRSGLPAQGNLWSVTVVATHCEQAEVAAKVAFILGHEKGSNFLLKHQLAGLFVGNNGSWKAVEPWPIHLMEEK
jgi:FAD:protein FMN transferase